jgi:hypothetical protein
MRQTKRTQLAEKFFSAFAESKYPIGSIGDSIELNRIINKNWREVRLDDINGNNSFASFSKQGLRYFLPSYITLTLTNFESMSTNVHHMLVHDLGKLDEIIFRDRKEKFCELFTDQQRNIIVEFLKSYQEMFPLPSENLSSIEVYLTSEWQNQQKISLEEAIKYWEGC